MIIKGWSRVGHVGVDESAKGIIKDIIKGCGLELGLG